MAKQKVRGKNRDNARRSKKKVSILTQEKVEYVDYKDVNLLRRFMSDRAKIRARRVTGNDSHQQKEVARAIKNAREMALLPYTNRVTQTRASGGRRGDGPSAEGPMPVPSAPPPSRSSDEADEATQAEVTTPDESTPEAAAPEATAPEAAGPEAPAPEAVAEPAAPEEESS
jgi:small subunit ribosomal protein S18